MVDVVVPAAVKQFWQNSIDLLSDISGHKVVLLSCGEQHGLPDRVVAVSADFPNINTFIRAFSSVMYEALENKTRTAKTQPADGCSILALPVYRPNQSGYGALCMLSEPHVSFSPESILLAENIAGRIQQDLYRCSQNPPRTNQDEVLPPEDKCELPDLQTFINSFDDHIWIKSPDGAYLTCNTKVEEGWGKKVSDIIGKKDPELFDKELADKFARMDQAVISNGHQMVVEECANPNATDTAVWLETIKAPIVNEAGKCFGTVGMTRNVTNRKVVEEQLMLAGTVFENSQEGVVITDRHGNIVYVNPAFSTITGYTQLEALGRNPRMLKSGRHDKKFYLDLWYSLKKDGTWNGEIWNRRKNGAVYPQLATITVVYNDQQEMCNYVGVFSDISQQKQNEAKLVHMAYHDPLTGLPNRMKLSSQIEQEIWHVQRHGGMLAVIFIDLDHFKHINDSYGHLIGDEVLCELAERLRNRVREQDTVSRIGGDEFVLLLSDLWDFDAVTTVVSKLMTVFDSPVGLNNGDCLRISGSMGIALYPEDGDDGETLLRNADAAMYRAKQAGRNDYAFYTQALTDESVAHLRLQSALHDAIEHDGFHLVYQPQVDIATGKLLGFEALIRWEDPKLGFVSPMEFIPVAEQVGLIHDIGLWVLREACSQGMQWLQNGYRFGRIAVNVAGQQLQRASFVENVRRILQETGFPASHLELEVTENFMMLNSEESVNCLKVLRGLGIELSIDDFGTGYSSLSYLQKLPLNKLKIDRSFVKNIPHNMGDIAIADAIIALGHALSLNVIAEGVETVEQAQFLLARGCRRAQGYYYCRPEKPAQLETLLKNQKVELEQASALAAID